MSNADRRSGSIHPGVLVSGVSRRFSAPGGDVEALQDVTATIRRGALTVLAGPSGSGKSTLLMLIAAADIPSNGDIEVDGRSLPRRSRRGRRRWRRDHVGIVLPQPSENLTATHDAVGNVMWASSIRRAGTPLDQVAARALLQRVGLDGLAESPIVHLSGGEQMRLAVACAIVGDPTLVIVDEPTASLDAQSAQSVIDLLRQIATEGATVIVATHDAAIIDIADDVLRLDHGRLVS